MTNILQFPVKKDSLEWMIANPNWLEPTCVTRERQNRINKRIQDNPIRMYFEETPPLWRRILGRLTNGR